MYVNLFNSHNKILAIIFPMLKMRDDPYLEWDRTTERILYVMIAFTLGAKYNFFLLIKWEAWPICSLGVVGEKKQSINVSVSNSSEYNARNSETKKQKRKETGGSFFRYI